MQKDAWDVIVNWHTNQCVKYQKFQHLALMDDRQFTNDDFDMVSEVADASAQIELFFLKKYLARVGRPDILWTVNA